MRRARLAAFVLLLIPSATSADPVVVTQVGDAYVSHDAGANTWTLGTSAVGFTLALAPATLHAVDLRSPRLAAPLAITAGPDTTLIISGHNVTLDASDFETFRASELPDGVRLDLIFTVRSERVRVTRSYAVYQRTPIVEAWTKIEALTSTATVQGLNVWQLTVPTGTVRTVTGLSGDDADNANPDVAHQFTIEREEIPIGRRLDFGSTGRSSEETVPWFAIERSDAVFFGGLMWSGSWTLSIERTGSSMRAALGLAGTVTSASPDRAVET